MLDHLISGELDPVIFQEMPDDFVPMAKATPAQTIDAKVATADWLKDLGFDDDKVKTEAETQTARAAFATLTTGSMLTAYDWEFVNQAKELRGYAVAKILEDCENPNANIRLKALGLLGKVTEVGLFTDKVEIKQTAMSDAEVEQRIKDKLNRFMGVIDVIDVSAAPDDIPENGSSYTLTPDEPVQTDVNHQA
jgi:hypothetical protein